MSIPTSTVKAQKLNLNFNRQNWKIKSRPSKPPSLLYIQKNQKEPVKSPRLTQCANEGQEECPKGEKSLKFAEELTIETEKGGRPQHCVQDH